MTKKKKLKEGPKTSTKVLTCYCEHKFQDDRYGKKKRLFNRTGKDGEWRCTVCGKNLIV